MSLEKIITKNKYSKLSCSELQKRKEWIIEKIKEARDQGMEDLAKQLQEEYKRIAKALTEKGCELE